MKYETFEGLVNLVVDMYKTSYERDQAIAKALGGDTVVVTEDVGKAMDRITDILTAELEPNCPSDKESWVDYLVFENMIMDDYDPKVPRIEIDGKRYPATPKVVWDILNGTLSDASIFS